MVSDAARKNLEAHIAGERRRDLDALMAPLSDHPFYVITDYLLDGREAVRAMYERVLPILNDQLSDEYLRALDDPNVASWGDRHCVLEYTDDYPLHRNMIVVVHFDGDKVKSENTYFRTSKMMKAPVDEAFLATPGVIPIT